VLWLQISHACLTVNHMVQYQARLDATFAALSDVTRRGVLEQLGGSDASITDLAQRFQMTLTCKLGQRRLEEEAAWIERHRQLWSARFDALDDLVEHLKRKEKADVQSKRK
jgi:DNA-binding transcriptional ArsR family regulator